MSQNHFLLFDPGEDQARDIFKPTTLPMFSRCAKTDGFCDEQSLSLILYRKIRMAHEFSAAMYTRLQVRADVQVIVYAGQSAF